MAFAERYLQSDPPSPEQAGRWFHTGEWAHMSSRRVSGHVAGYAGAVRVTVLRCCLVWPALVFLDVLKAGSHLHYTEGTTQQQQQQPPIRVIGLALFCCASTIEQQQTTVVGVGRSSPKQSRLAGSRGPQTSSCCAGWWWSCLPEQSTSACVSTLTPGRACTAGCWATWCHCTPTG